MPESDRAHAFSVTGTNGTAIRSLADWKQHGGPKRAHQWKARASAMELARAWCEDGASGAPVAPRPPPQMLDVLNTHPKTRGFVPLRGMAEHMTDLDGFRGEHRNHDLVLVGNVMSGERILIAIEAKALEPFGDKTVGQQIAAARAKNDEIRDRPSIPGRTRPPVYSNIESRVELLAQALFGRSTESSAGPIDETLRDLRYQLLTAAAGAAIEARVQQCATAVLLVHEFVSRRPDETPAEAREHARNMSELRRFARAFGAAEGPGSNRIVDLGHTHATEFAPDHMPLLLAHVTTELGAREHV